MSKTEREYIDSLMDKIRDLSEINHKLEQENKELKSELALWLSKSITEREK